MKPIFTSELRSHIPANQKVVGKFNFKPQTTHQLGHIWRPEIEISCWSDRHTEWQRYSVLIDTGADYTMLPRYVAALLGIELAGYTTTQTTGIGGTQKVYFVPEVTIKVGNAEREIPVGFVDSNQVPPLLGRHACLDTFTLVLDHHRKILLAE
jgi:predicted aspartyl protease